MNPLVKKEIRLLLPAWIAAMALAMVPCWIVQYFEIPTVAANNFPPPLFIMFGMLFLGITSFGNEISFRTFPLLLSQPVPRNRIWRVKVTLLGAAPFDFGCFHHFMGIVRFLSSGLFAVFF